MRHLLLRASAILLITLSGCGPSDCCSQGDTKLVLRVPIRKAEPARDVPVQVGGEVTAPVLLRKVEPALPDREKHALRTRPFMLFELVVDRSGNVTNVRTLKANDETLLQYVVPAIQQWKFRPATLHGKPVTVLYNISFSYEVR